MIESCQVASICKLGKDDDDVMQQTVLFWLSFNLGQASISRNSWHTSTV